MVLSGGTLAPIPPRPTIEVDDAGDRVLYGAHLYHQGSAHCVVCTGGAATGDRAPHPAADDMRGLLEQLGIPEDAILEETRARNTHEHAVGLLPVFESRGFHTVLLVTSAMHMPRAMGVFRRLCPGVHFIAAPTDFRAVDRMPTRWYNQVCHELIPTAYNLARFSDAMHEYLGILYYRLRGWL